MRIVTGIHKGHALSRPPGHITRPMMDKVRESVFNILMHQNWKVCSGTILEGAIVLDAFAGSGAIGLEAISRGAKQAYFFDKSPKALGIVRENVWNLKEQDRCKLLKVDATNPPRAPQSMDLVFLDPPFGKNLVLACLPPLIKTGWINNNTIIVAEVESGKPLSLPAGVHILLEKSYGAAQVFFLQLT
ncbi:MAG: 16S rRNA (guanine(966)-N(2))-methyltransferase RsmD [Pseudomonadota bacterium]